jgi:hypothetical protein
VRKLVVVLLLCGACKPKDATPEGKASASPQAETSAANAADMEKLEQAEGEVQARRDEISREREKITAEHTALEEKRKEVVAQGGDVKAVDDAEQALRAREANLLEKQSDLDKKIDTLITDYHAASAAPANGPGDNMARRELGVANREKDFSRREQLIAQREATLAERERDLAKRERETCSVQPAPIIQTVPAPPPAGSHYSKRDVEPLLQSARRKMTEKGLLAGDLPAPANRLEREAMDAMGTGDFGRAKFAADQLLATIDGLHIDRGFVAAKINRLAAAWKSSKLADDIQQQVSDLFREATADYGDGKYTSANGKLNRIYALVQ